MFTAEIVIDLVFTIVQAAVTTIRSQSIRSQVIILGEQIPDICVGRHTDQSNSCVH